MTPTTTHRPTLRHIINGVRFAPIWGMSGVQNFHGQGWPHHRHLKRIKADPKFSGATLVAKTTTIKEREGKMPLDKYFMPTEAFPKCIHVSLLSCRVLNAVSLSGPGYEELLDCGLWQKQREPFFLSFMSVEKQMNDRLKETQEFVDMTMKRRNELRHFGVQINKSCPNTEGHAKADTKEIGVELEIVKPMHDVGIPVIYKFGLDTAPETIMEFADDDALDGICISNTVPFGTLFPKWKWRMWYPFGSPLLRRGVGLPGGLSGPPLRKPTLAWVRRLRALGFEKHINAGAGIIRPGHIDMFDDAGADSFAIGSVAITRPWRVRHIINRAYQVAG